MKGTRSFLDVRRWNFNLEQWGCRRIVFMDKAIFYIFATFSLWYWIECVLFLFIGHGMFMSLLYASEVYYDFYFTALTGYALITFFYTRRRWGSVFIVLWAVTWIVVCMGKYFFSFSFGELEGALLDKITGMVFLVFFVRLSAKVVSKRNRLESEKASCD